MFDRCRLPIRGKQCVLLGVVCACVFLLEFVPYKFASDPTLLYQRPPLPPPSSAATPLPLPLPQPNQAADRARGSRLTNNTSDASLTHGLFPVEGQTSSEVTRRTAVDPRDDPVTEEPVKEWCSRADAKAGKDVVFFDTDQDYLLPKLRASEGLRVREGLGLRREKPSTDFERCLLASPPLEDARLAPDELRSKVSLVSPKLRYQVGDRVQFRADLLNGYGLQRTSGGDDIRMRLVSSKDGEQQSSSVAADVTDLRNGSYLGTTFLPWRGMAELKVYVTYPREFLREAVRLRLSLSTTKYLMARYENGGARENTACLPSAPIPGYGAVCNYTRLNGGVPYFCGRPTTTHLNCSHRKVFSVRSSLTPLPLSGPHRELMKKIDRKPPFRLIPNNITITVQSGSTTMPQTGSRRRHYNTTSNLLAPCWKMTPRSTWLTRAPLGWMDNGSWRSFTCSLPRRAISPQRVRRCLRGTSVFLVGDSNMRVWWYELRSYFNRCSTESLGGGNLHVHRLCEVDSLNTTLRWAFHARPSSTSPKSDNMPLPLVLETLRQHIRNLHRRVVVIIHYYIHFSFFNVGFFQERVKAAKGHIRAFLQEFPDAKIVIRGSHAILDAVQESHAVDGDLFGPVYNQIWRQEFRELRDKVWFLDFWDMTVATQNQPSHPPHPTIREMVKVLLGYLCDNL